MSKESELALGKIRNKKRRMARDYKDVFAGRGGEEVLSDMVARSGFAAPLLTMTPDGHYDPLKAAYNEGKRVFMLDILNILNYEEIDARELLQKLQNTAE